MSRQDDDEITTCHCHDKASETCVHCDRQSRIELIRENMQLRAALIQAQRDLCRWMLKGGCTETKAEPEILRIDQVLGRTG